MAQLQTQRDALAAEIRDRFPLPEIDTAFIESHFDELPLFSAAEFHRRLPAYLLYCLERWDPGSMVCEFTIYGVSPGKEYLDTPWWQERYRPFEPEQIELVLRFLALAAADTDFAGIFRQVKRSAERIQKLYNLSQNEGNHG